LFPKPTLLNNKKFQPNVCFTTKRFLVLMPENQKKNRLNRTFRVYD